MFYDDDDDDNDGEYDDDDDDMMDVMDVMVWIKLDLNWVRCICQRVVH